MSSVDECDCGQDGDWWACIGGLLYGPCESDRCGGVCEFKGECDHDCHKPTPDTTGGQQP